MFNDMKLFQVMELEAKLSEAEKELESGGKMKHLKYIIM